MSESTPYRGAHRYNLDDDSEIEALEAARRGEPAKPAEPQLPDPEGEPPALTKPPADVAEATYAKRYADLRRHAQQTEARLKGEVEAIKAQLATASQKAFQLPTNEEEVAQWTKEYPDIARIVEAIAARKANERITDTEKRIQAAEARERDAAKRAAIAELMRLHPDFGELRNDPAFHEWAGQQPRWVQSALYDDLDARAAARAIDLFKMDTAPKRGRPRREEGTSAAEAPAPRSERRAPDPNEGKRTWRESEVAKLRPAEWEQHEDEIMLARREGRFVYDRQGAA